MRVAPAGLAGGDPFTLGGQAAALTHGHPSGYLAAAAFAQMISHLAGGGTLPDAVGEGLAAVRGAPGSGAAGSRDGSEVSAALAAAVAAAAAGPPSTEAMCSLGAGWAAEEALAVAVYCALTDAGLLDDLEGRDVITQVADDLYDVFAEGGEPSAERYPG
jgi:ADP-ribosylglycohydrolase